MEITVVDSIMGSGKTSAMLNHINATPEKSYIYVTPFLDEVDRVIHATRGRFRQPHPYGKSKIEALRELLAAGADIATTHALFWMVTPEIIQLIKEGCYTLILDEELDTLREYNEAVKSIPNKAVYKGTVEWLIGKGHMTVSDSYQATWTDMWHGGYQYSEVQKYASMGILRCVNGALFLEFPIEAIQAFEEVFVLTYLFDGSQLASYMRIHGLTYTKMSASGEGQRSHLCPYTDSADERRKISDLIDIYDGALNQIGRKASAFSVSWSKDLKSERLKRLKNDMWRYRRSVGAIASAGVMWTATKQEDFWKKLERTKGFKYVRKLTAEEKALSDKDKAKKKLMCFVPCNARATNDFHDRTVLLYLLNRYLDPDVEKYYSRLGCPISKDTFALSEMLQWIWRSAIRDGKPIHIYVPSCRMRQLLRAWLAGA